jgi:hypothetical protein
MDWHNHEWLAAYAGEYLRQHGALPAVINTAEQAGMPYPIFYATILYPLLAPLTAWCGPGLAIRIVVVAVTALELRLVSQALAAVGLPSWPARGAACLVIWAIYPLTNLYNRAAIPEYIATGLLTCAVALWFLTAQALTTTARKRCARGFGLVLALLAGSHPITALYALPVLALLVVTTYVARGGDRVFWRSMLAALWRPTALAVVVIAPWAYALAKFQPHLQITSSSAVNFYPGIDEWRTRFCPLPYDPRASAAPLESVSCPYLDAQTNVALAALVVGWLTVLAWRRRGGGRAYGAAIAPAFAVGAMFAWMSLSPSSFDRLPEVARRIQIAYRAITYQNIALLVALFSLAIAASLRRDGPLFDGGHAPGAVLLACIALSAAGVLVKWKHASAIMKVDGAERAWPTAAERESWSRLPPDFYGANAYATPSLYRELGADAKGSKRAVSIPVGAGAKFGFTQPLHLDERVDSWLTTNVQAFPWNHLVLDGVTVPAQELRVDGVLLAVHVNAGPHTLELRTAPDDAWLLARLASFGTISLWLGWALRTAAGGALGTTQAPLRRRGLADQIEEVAWLVARETARRRETDEHAVHLFV